MWSRLTGSTIKSHILLTHAVCVILVVKTGLLKSQRHGRGLRINVALKREVAQHFPTHLLSTITHPDTRLNSSSNPRNMTL